MDWSFTQEQDEIARLARDILIRSLTETRMREVEATQERFDRELFSTLGGAGLLGVGLPAELGGGGRGFIEEYLVLAELGRAVAPVPALPTMVGAGALAAFGGDDEIVRSAAQGRTVIAPALVEESSRDASSPATSAERSGDGWLLHGTKTTVPAGTVAELYLVTAATDEGPAVFIVDRASPGVSVSAQKVTNTDAEAVLELDGASGRRLGGHEAIEWLVRRSTVGLCAMQLGILERALELTAEYAKQRVQFDRPIATFQAVGQRLADAFIDVEGVRLTTWQAAWRLSEGLPADTEIATAKFWAADAGHRVAHTAVHVHGGVGIDLDYPLQRYFVAAKRIEFALGAATEQLVAIGAALAAEPA